MMTTTASDLRSKIARERVLIYRVAVRLGLHPSRLSLLLNERIPLSAEIAERALRAIEEEATAR